MREILFKAKTIKSGKWVEGLLWKKKYKSDNVYISCFPDKDDNEEVYCVDSDTICQYTGLTDKNGNKIWENDVVIVNGCYKGKVIWSETWANYMVIGNGNINISIHNRWDDIYEVIGNIFDNPELLKGE